jgi:hypothetical protein
MSIFYLKKYAFITFVAVGPPIAQDVTLDRAYTSPIWYTP